ncbi:MAG TPA: hypothetical protein VLD65_13335 [Anaerolineales bacterium]|nr:hypothetical protein [Anaerolineales bacterium]
MKTIANHHRSIFFITAPLFALVLFSALLIMSCKGTVVQPTPSGQVTRLAATAGRTVTVEPTPGLVISGRVLDEQGGGVENVQIYRNYSAYPGEVIATTDASGFYESDFYYIHGDEMVAVWAEKPGFSFEPQYYRWRHYYGNEQTQCDFLSHQP